MASVDLTNASTVTGANLSLDVQTRIPTLERQWLTQPMAASPLQTQTSPVQAFARTTAIMDCNYTEFRYHGKQQLECKLPVGEMDMIGAITAIVNVPSIANQTGTAVTKKGVDAGVATITIPDMTDGVDVIDSQAINAGFLVADFPNGETRTLSLETPTGVPARAVATGTGFSATITRTSAVEDISSFTVNIVSSGTGYTEGDLIAFTWDGGDIDTDSIYGTLSAATTYDGTAITIVVDAAPAAGKTATATAARVPADVVSTASGFDVTITDPGYGYTSAPAVTVTGGGFTGSVAGTTTLTAAATGENLRYIVPGAASGRDQATFSASDSDATVATNVGTAVLVESDIVASYENVVKSISGLTFPSAVDSNYYNALDGGMQDPDVAAYFTPYAPCMLFEEASIYSGSTFLDGVVGEQILKKNTVYTSALTNPARLLHASMDKRELKRWSAQPGLQWYVKLPLFTADLASPYLCAAARTVPLRLVLKTRPWSSIVCNGSGGRFASLEQSHSITVSAGTVQTVKLEPLSGAVSTVLARTSPASTSAGTVLTYSDFSVQVMVEGYLLDDRTRASVQTRQVVLPFVQHLFQKHDESAITGASRKTVAVDLPFGLPVTAVHWAGRLKSSELQHRWADFGIPNDPVQATRVDPKGAPKPPFKTCEVVGNLKTSLSLKRPASYFLEPQQVHYGRNNLTNLNFYSYHFCAGNPDDLQHSSYVDSGCLDQFRIMVEPDPEVFADNSGVLGNNGKSTASSPTVTDGEEITFRYWADARNFLIFQNGAMKPGFR
jgi:hypothetical protein